MSIKTCIPQPIISKGGTSLVTPLGQDVTNLWTYWDNGWWHLCLMKTGTKMVDGKKVNEYAPKAFSDKELKLKSIK